MIKTLRKKTKYFPSNNNRNNQIDPDNQRVMLLNILAFIGVLTLSIFVFINVTIDIDYFAAFFESIVIIFLVISWYHMRQTNKFHLIYLASLILIYSTSYNNFLRGGYQDTGIYYIFIFPVAIFFISGARRGALHTIIFICSLVFLNILRELGYTTIPYSNFEILILLSSLLIISVVIFSYQATLEATQNSFIKQSQLLKEKNQEYRVTLKDKIVKEDRINYLFKEISDRNQLLERTKQAMINVLEDVEEEKLKQEKQAEELKKFYEAVENASDHIVITDPDGIILYANNAVTKVTGYSKDEVLGQTPSLWGKQMDETFYKKFWNTIKHEKKKFDGELINKRKDGSLYTAEIHVSPILDNQGNLKFFMGLERDITKNKEIDKMKTEFVSVASHQLRTPLTSMKWFVEILRNEEPGKLNPQQKAIIESLHQSNMKMITLVNDLLNVSRIETGVKFSIDRKNCDIIKMY